MDADTIATTLVLARDNGIKEPGLHHHMAKDSTRVMEKVRAMTSQDMEKMLLKGAARRLGTFMVRITILKPGMGLEVWALGLI